MIQTFSLFYLEDFFYFNIKVKKNKTVKYMKLNEKKVYSFYSRDYLLTLPFCCNRMLFNKSTQILSNKWDNVSN